MTTLTILGCSGGLGKGEFTTSYLIDDSILIDAGTGLGTLTQPQLKSISSVLLTHAHLDHICGLPLLVDNLFGSVDHTLDVYAAASVIESLRQHIFNWKIWPDFSQLPSPDSPSVRFHAIEAGESVTIGSLEFTAFKVPHVVPAQGYFVRGEHATLAYASDTGFSAELIKSLDSVGAINNLILECAWSDAEQDLADISGHLTPSLVQEVINALQHKPEKILITHLKPSQAEKIKSELNSLSANCIVVASGDQYAF
jgi:ribonuclease BN (tRNA processing enzyme)